MKPMYRRTLWRLSGILLLIWLAGVWAAPAALAQSPGEGGDQVLEGMVLSVEVEEQREVMGQEQLYQRLRLVITAGPRRGETLTVENGDLAMVNVVRYRPGDRVFLDAIATEDGATRYVVDGYSRWRPLVWGTVLFVAVVALAAGWRSISSLVGLAFSFGVVFAYILPRLAEGHDPMGTALMGGVIIIPVTFYLAHGFSVKTHTAVAGTFIALGATVLLTQYFIGLTALTGYASDEALFLQAESSTALDIRGLLMAGIVVGVLGVLDDITVSQAAIVAQLRRANAALNVSQLYFRAMRVGQDHITSMINTLALVYAGAALPLLLLLRTSTLPLTYLVSKEIITEEIVRMLISSIGMTLAVPITTLLAAAWVARTRPALTDDTPPIGTHAH